MIQETRILIVDDEPALSEPLAFLLEKEGYSTTIAADGPSAVSKFKDFDPDLVLLDLMLPGFSGIEVCRRIRDISKSIPIIMLTAKGDETDIVVGLELGADDYITKPYSIKELLARVKAVLRRNVFETEESQVLRSNSIEIDSDRHLVTVRGEAVQMPLKEFELLELLIRNRGRALTRSQLIDRVWGSNYFGDTKTLDVHVKRLRSKIEVDPSNPIMLVTLRGLGYRLDD